MTNPISNPGQIAAERDVIAMLEDPRIAPTVTMIEGLFRTGYGDRIPADTQDRMHDFSKEYLTNWLFKAAACDSQHPRFVRDFMPAHSWHGHDVPGARTGGDNPDNCYRLAGIEHGSSYRVTGQLRDDSAPNVSFVLHGNWGTSVTIHTLESHELECDGQGRFAITIDDRPADGRPNHMTTQPHVQFLFVRDSMMDWTRETPLDLAIELVGEPKRAPLTREEMLARGIAQAFNDLWLYFWFQNIFSGLAPNTMLPVEPAGQGGLQTQSGTRGNFNLGPDDAAVLEFSTAGAAYCAVQLTDWTFRSLDYERIQSSLTTAQARADSDGLYRLVVARRDPGMANWLDTDGLAHVFAFIRWQGLPPNGDLPHFKWTMTTIGELDTILPSDTLRLTQVEREEVIRVRRSAYARRIAE